MSSVKSYSRDLDSKSKILIGDASLNSLALGAVAIMPTAPQWVHALITDYDEQPYVGAFMTIMQQLVIRTSAGYSTKNVREVVPAMAATHTISVEKGKENAFITNDYKEVKMQTISGIQVPTNYPNAAVKCVITALVDGAFIGVNQKKLGPSFEIKASAAELVGFPFKPLYVKVPFPKGTTRAGLIQGSYERAVRSPDYAEQLLDDLPEGVTFDFLTGKYKYPPPTMLSVKDAQQLFYSIWCHRETRGSDKDARHYISAPYYFGLPTRSLFQNAYVIIDIQALGAALKIKMLEITNTDSIINAHVLSSLVATGWLIRVVGSNQYPERVKNPQGNYVQAKGVFSYFEYDDMFLRWYYVRETAPKVVNNTVTLVDNTPKVVNHLFSISRSENAVPFGYVYVNDQMLTLEQHYPGCSLFPTAHAHNGHVIVVRTKIHVPMLKDWRERAPLGKKREDKKDGDKKKENIKDGKEEPEYVVGPLDYKLYLKRVMEACIWKTYYVFSRTRYFEVDPFAHHVNFVMRNQKEADKDNFVSLTYEKEMNMVFDFDRVFAIKQPTAKYLAFLPPVVTEKRELAAKVVEIRRKMKIEVDPEKKEMLEEEEIVSLDAYNRSREVVILEDKKSRNLSVDEVQVTTGDPITLEVDEADDSLFAQVIEDEDII